MADSAFPGLTKAGLTKAGPMKVRAGHSSAPPHQVVAYVALVPGMLAKGTCDAPDVRQEIRLGWQTGVRVRSGSHGAESLCLCHRFDSLGRAADLIRSDISMGRRNACSCTTNASDPADGYRSRSRRP